MNTRVAVRLSEEGYEAVSFLSKISGKARGAILAETVEAAIPSFIKIADAYRKAAALDDAARAEYLEGMRQAENVLLTVLEQMNTDFLPAQPSRPAPPPSSEGSGGVGGDGTPDTLTGGSTTSNLGGNNAV